MRRTPVLVCVLLLLAPASGPAEAKEANPIQPAFAKRLEDPKTCVAIAAEVGERVLAMGAKTKTGLSFGKGPAVYGGDAGVALLFAGLYRATKATRWLQAARGTLDQAVSELPQATGLYTGSAGIGQACVEAWWATGDKHFLDQARRCVPPQDVAYPGTDIIYGAAGTGIFLLNLHAATKDKAHLAAARAVGDYLVKHAVRKDGRAHWPVTPRKGARVYLGFSHGAAGIGYVLLHLGLRTKHKGYLELAEEAGAFVLAHEESEGEEGAHWWRSVPKSSDWRRVQWCHGAPGTGLFFHDMHRFARKQAWTDALTRCLETTRVRGRTARVGGCQCHGVAGNAELFLEAYASGKDKQWLLEARRSGSALLVEKDGALRLHDGPTPRSRYDASYMLGLAGIGHFYLRLADPVGTPLPMMVRP